MFEHGGAVGLLGIQDNACRRRANYRSSGARSQPLSSASAWPHVVTVELEQIERAQDGVGM